MTPCHLSVRFTLWQWWPGSTLSTQCRLLFFPALTGSHRAGCSSCHLPEDSDRSWIENSLSGAVLQERVYACVEEALFSVYSSSLSSTANSTLCCHKSPWEVRSFLFYIPDFFCFGVFGDLQFKILLNFTISGKKQTNLFLNIQYLDWDLLFWRV